MDVILLDTDVVSFIFKGDSRAADYEPHFHERQLAISFMTVAELYQWATIHNWGESRRDRLTESIRADYTVLSFDFKLCQIWGEIRAARRSIGKPISPQDAWIAATALHYDIPLVTHNPKDFVDISDLNIITTVE